jgi:hypothetical protein
MTNFATGIHTVLLLVALTLAGCDKIPALKTNSGPKTLSGEFVNQTETGSGVEGQIKYDFHSDGTYLQQTVVSLEDGSNVTKVVNKGTYQIQDDKIVLTRTSQVLSSSVIGDKSSDEIVKSTLHLEQNGDLRADDFRFKRK